MKISSKLNELKPIDLNCNVFDVYSYDGLSMQDLLCQFFTKINECIKVSNETIDLASWLVNEGLKKEVVEKLMLWLNDGTLENLINVNLFNTLHTKIAHIEKNNIRSPQHYGAKGNGIDDDSDYLLEAMNDCATNGYVLMLNGKYKIAKNIIYKGWKPLLIIGTSGNYPSLIKDNLEQSMESYDLFFSDGATLELNKMGSVTFQCVGFASTSKENGTGILLKSFHNKFINCSFTQMNKAIYATSGALNWLGENQVLYSNFYKCGYCYYSDAGSDSEFIGNLIHSGCDVGFYGDCAGYTISNNHFYNSSPNVFKYFNTKITNNYIQELPDLINPSIILEGSFGCMVNSNNFELVTSEPRGVKKGLIGIKLLNGMGNITIDGNAVHGKNLSKVGNLSFIQLIYSGSRYDMPIHYGTNNIRCCSAILNEYYPIYNIKGSLSMDDFSVISQGGEIKTQTSQVINGVCHFYVEMSKTPAYENILKVQNYGGLPFTYTLKQVLNDNSINYRYEVSYDGFIKQSNYSQVKSVEAFGNYVLQHSNNSLYNL